MQRFLFFFFLLNNKLLSLFVQTSFKTETPSCDSSTLVVVNRCLVRSDLARRDTDSVDDVSDVEFLELSTGSQWSFDGDLAMCATCFGSSMYFSFTTIAPGDRGDRGAMQEMFAQDCVLLSLLFMDPDSMVTLSSTSEMERWSTDKKREYSMFRRGKRPTESDVIFDVCVIAPISDVDSLPCKLNCLCIWRFELRFIVSAIVSGGCRGELLLIMSSKSCVAVLTIWCCVDFESLWVVRQSVDIVASSSSSSSACSFDVLGNCLTLCNGVFSSFGSTIWDDSSAGATRWSNRKWATELNSPSKAGNICDSSFTDGRFTLKSKYNGHTILFRNKIWRDHFQWIFMRKCLKIGFD